MKVKTPDNMCVMCGAVIPEGRQACPHCEAAVCETTDKIMTKVNDELERAFRQGYTTGFNEGMKAACELKQQNAQLRKDHAILRAAIERRDSEENKDGWYE